jgi:glycosyltransferase involved in cell wall biosynthesis
MSPPISSPCPPVTAGAEQVAYYLNKHLPEFERHIICTWQKGYAEQETSEGIGYHRIRIGRAYKRIMNKWLGIDPCSYAMRATTVLNRLKPDIVHFHSKPSLAAAVIGKLAYQPAKVLFHIHNKTELPRDLVCDGFVGCSQAILDEVVDRAVFPSTPQHVVYNGVDTKRFQPASQTTICGHDFRDRFVVGCVARISEEKGIDFLVDTFLQHNLQQQGVTLVIAGEIRRDKRAEERTRFAQTILEKAAHSNGTIILLDEIPYHDIHQLYHVSDICIQPSRREALGLSILEAMACGRPVIGTRVGGIPELIRDSQEGFLVPFGETGTLAQQILSYKKSSSQLATHATAARRRAKAFAWDVVAEQLREVYNR